MVLDVHLTKGLRMKREGILQSFIVKEPLDINYDTDTIEDIEKVEYAIEQHVSFLKSDSCGRN
jgi:hypothetical protein